MVLFGPLLFPVAHLGINDVHYAIVAIRDWGSGCSRRHLVSDSIILSIGRVSSDQAWTYLAYMAHSSPPGDRGRGPWLTTGFLT